MTPIDMSEVQTYLGATKNVLDIAKVMIGMLPKGSHHDDAQKRLLDAEKAMKAAEVQLAKALGYNLCQCTFPPQIMLSKGQHPTHGEEIFSCDNCKKQSPSQMHFDALDKYMADNRSSHNNYF